MLNDAVVESTSTRSLPAAERRLHVAGHPYPIDLRSISSIVAYRTALGRAQTLVGRERDGKGGGHPIKQIRLHVQLPGRLRWHTSDLARHLAKPRRCFALLARSSIYDVERASRELETDTWRLRVGELDAGDRFVIWRTTGPDGQRGIVAVGEVLESPELRDESPSSRAYWRESPPAEQERRLTLRYVPAPGLPLWLGNDTTGLLEQLSIRRGQGTKLYNITFDQWLQLMELTGADFGDSQPQSESGGISSELLEDEEEDALRAAPLPETDRVALINARRGQGRFRSEVMKLEPRCRVTSVDDERLLVASHIWPWRYATNEERLDPSNGLMLAPHIDTLFDQGLISFDDHGTLLTASDLRSETIEQLKLPVKSNVGPFRPAQQAYLARHRCGIYRRD